MLAFVPVVFDVYRSLKPRWWPVMQVLVAHADRAGQCWPGVRRIGAITGVPKSTVARYLLALERAGHITRQWRRGKGCVYTIAARFLPEARVSHSRAAGVPPARTEEKGFKKKEGARARFAPFGELPDERGKWEARMRAWEKSRFWLPFWGPKPGERGCLAPPPHRCDSMVA